MHPSVAEQVASAQVRDLLGRPQRSRRPRPEAKWPNVASRLLAWLAPVLRRTRVLAGDVPAAERPV